VRRTPIERERQREREKASEKDAHALAGDSKDLKSYED
jgi:hypothetical protein